jgi:hypothetical protein
MFNMGGTMELQKTHMIRKKVGLAAAIVLILALLFLLNNKIITAGLSQKNDIMNASISFISEQTYTGEEIKPQIIAKYQGKRLQEGVDYDLFYHNNVMPGTATAGIVGKKLYYGIKPISFRIVIKIEKIVGLKQNTSAAHSMQLTWSKVKAADGYEIYRKKKGTKKALRIDTVPGKTTVYIDRKLRSATSYVYQIRAYKKVKNKMFYGKYSRKITMATRVKMMHFSKLQLRNSAKVSLYWNKQPKADGYQIVRANSSTDSFSILKTIRSNNVTEYTNIIPSDQHLFYYKIRAYKKVGGKKIFGDFSPAQKVVIKVP